MGLNYGTAWCHTCARPTRFAQKEPSHVFHLLLTFLTCGLWLPMWFAVWSFSVLNAWRCTFCGMKRGKRCSKRMPRVRSSTSLST